MCTYAPDCKIRHAPYIHPLHTGRYAHRREYVEAAANKAGLETLVVEEMVGRKDKGRDIPGYLFLMRRR